MYAVIESGCKQYRVSEGDVVQVEKIGGQKGDKLNFEGVLMVGGNGKAKIGQPLISGANVDAEVVRQGRSKKIVVYKKKRRKGYEVRKGHRQSFTEVKVLKINA